MKKSIKVAICSRTFYNNLNLRKKFQKKLNAKVKFNKSNYTLKNKELINFIGFAETIIIGLECLDKKIIDKLPNVKKVIKYGVGLDKIDINYLKKKKIKLIHFPGFNKRSVSELVLCFILSYLRNFYKNVSSTKKKIWLINKGRLLTNKKIGIVGCGNIGKDLIKILKPYENKIFINDIKSLSSFIKKNKLKKVSKEFIFKHCDIITIHIPYSPQNKNIINKKYLNLMKNESLLINTSRGNIVDENDLKKLLNKRNNIHAYFDVLSHEPLKKTNILLNSKKFFLTPHIGGNTEEAIIDGGIKCLKKI